MDFVRSSFDFFTDITRRVQKPGSINVGTKREFLLTKGFTNSRGILNNKVIDSLKLELNEMIRAFEVYLEIFVETKIPQK